MIKTNKQMDNNNSKISLSKGGNDLERFVEKTYLEMKGIVSGKNIDNKAYIFQTDYYENPNLLICGMHPGGDEIGSFEIGGELCDGSSKFNSNYTDESDKWFANLSEIFRYDSSNTSKDDSDIVSKSYSECVGMNLNPFSGDAEGKMDKDTLKALEEKSIGIIDKIAPKHIIALGVETFERLKDNGTKENTTKVDRITLRESTHNGIPLICIYDPNDTNMNTRYANTDLGNLQKRIENF